MFTLEVSKIGLTDFHTYVSAIKYVPNNENTFVLSSLVSDMFDAREHVAEQAIEPRLEPFLYCE